MYENRNVKGAEHRLLPWSWNTRRLSPRSPATFPLLLSPIWSTNKSRRPRSRDRGANRPNRISTSPRTGDKVSLISGLAINCAACDMITAFSQRTAILLLKAIKQHISASQILSKQHYRQCQNCRSVLLKHAAVFLHILQNNKKVILQFGSQISRMYFLRWAWLEWQINMHVEFTKSPAFFTQLDLTVN